MPTFKVTKVQTVRQVWEGVEADDREQAEELVRSEQAGEPSYDSRDEQWAQVTIEAEEVEP